MAVRDLLWACPRCRAGSLSPASGGDRCGRCGTVYRRGRGDRIVARAATGEEETRSAARWLDALNPPASAGEPERAVLRPLDASMRDVRYEGELIGWVERFGDPVEGTVRLTADRVTFTPANQGEMLEIQLDELTSIQPSSRKLVLGLRGGNAVALEFAESAVLRWELLLQAAVREHWAKNGRGTVTEYQPRIVAR